MDTQVNAIRPLPVAFDPEIWVPTPTVGNGGLSYLDALLRPQRCLPVAKRPVLLRMQVQVPAQVSQPCMLGYPDRFQEASRYIKMNAGETSASRFYSDRACQVPHATCPHVTNM